METDAHALVVTDRKDSTEHKFLWSNPTRSNEQGKAASAADLRAGEHVGRTEAEGGDLPALLRVRIATATTDKAVPTRS